MQRKKIEVGKTYALGDGRRSDNSDARRVRILAVDAPRTFRGKSYQFSRGGWDRQASGIIGIRADVPFDGPLPADDEIGFHPFSDKPFWIEPRDVWETWADWETLQGQRRVRQDVQRRQQNQREIEQQAEIDHMLGLLPSGWLDARNEGKYRWDQIQFKPGMTPHLTVADLTAMLKAARTEALREASEE